MEVSVFYFFIYEQEEWKLRCSDSSVGAKKEVFMNLDSKRPCVRPKIDPKAWKANQRRIQKVRCGQDVFNQSTGRCRRSVLSGSLSRLKGFQNSRSIGAKLGWKFNHRYLEQPLMCIKLTVAVGIVYGFALNNSDLAPITL